MSLISLISMRDSVAGTDCYKPGGGGLLPIMGYTVRLRQKGIPFVALGI